MWAVGFDRSTACARETPRSHGRSKPGRWEPTWQPHELEADDVARPEPQGLKHPVGEEEVVFGGAEVEVAVFFVVLFNFICVCGRLMVRGLRLLLGRDIYALYIYINTSEVRSNSLLPAVQPGHGALRPPRPELLAVLVSSEFTMKITRRTHKE